jgi:hypothetical protein
MKMPGVTTGDRNGSARDARKVSRIAFAFCSLSFVAASGVAGCGDHAPSEAQTSPGEGESLGESGQAVVSAQACVTINRVGASGGVADTQIGSPAPALTQNFGSSQNFNAGTSAGVARQMLLQFDVSGIPQGPSTNITNANLFLAQGPVAVTGPSTINVHQILAPWSESQVTWQSFGGAFSPTVAGSFTNASQFPSVNLSNLVTGWVRGTFPNDGVLLESAVNRTNFWSSENPSVNLRPALNVCFTVTCGAGFADCNHNGLDGCEVDTTSSAASCGACGSACNVPNAAPACVGSACAVGACNLGFGDCNHVAADGCETLLTTSANCGGCGIACALPNAASSCASGTCTLTACNAGHYDCDGNPGNGCEATPCGSGSHCATGAGCSSGVCQNGFCATPVCSDGVRNGGETAVDCGGGSCPPCAVGLACATGADCTTGVCTGGACAANACSDGVKNGAETAVDCGGPTCAPCATGKGCLVGSDCTTGVCTAGLCQAPSCNDGLKNGAESAVDCGGGACPACASGKGCNVGSDCVDLVCAGHVCQLGSCSDGVQNGAETDVDCGGPCAPCNAAARCTTSADCGSGVCQAGFCQSPSCSDGVKNGNETGVDCGGACFKPEVCNGIDDDCNGLVDDGLGATTCGVGACQVTVQNCVAGHVQTCVPLPPQAEVCDGLVDDDCDGVVDNGCACIDGKTQSCYTAAPGTLGVGVCQSGTQTCAHGQWGACAGEVTPTAETCDGLDNDCNGQVDEGLGQTICGVGACQATTPSCLNGVPQICTPRPPQPETCDGLDNDCNGAIDDLPALTCGVGACERTAPACVNGVAGTCAPGSPSAETCDGIDNDCDGVVDNGSPGANQACSTGNPGVCAAGTTACTGGAVVCNQNVQPSAETCDGIDNDCDGVVDNGNPGGNAACTTGHPGICAAGTTVCSGGHLACNQTQQPRPETCDGLDDDCDGVVDNGNPGGGLSCSTGNLGVCAAGTTSCAAGSVVCDQNVQPGAEVCDGMLDESCDGQVDEGCSCTNGATQPCYAGPAGTPGVGACRAGTQTCAGGQWGACLGQVLPTAETCNGLDDDCDGVVDDGLPTLSCGVGECVRAVPSCVNGQAQACVPGAPQAETCDGLDNDCDGVVDNGNPGGGVACTTGLPGVCGAGTTICVTGAIQCNQDVGPSAEACDGLDNDCNGVVDDHAGGCGGYSASALVCGGESMSSASYAMVSTVGESPAGGNRLTSAHYRFEGGIVGATQGP